MRDVDYLDTIELTYMGGGFVPENGPAWDLTERCVKGEVVAFKEITARDLSMHRCYFSLIGMVYDYLPKNFKKAVRKEDFYKFLKHLKGDYKVVFEFKDGTKMVEYDSIAFGRMSEKKFREYIAEQLPFIYSNVIGMFFEGEIYDNIVEVIEDEYKTFLTNLVG